MKNDVFDDVIAKICWRHYRDAIFYKILFYKNSFSTLDISQVIYRLDQ